MQKRRKSITELARDLRKIQQARRKFFGKYYENGKSPGIDSCGKSHLFMTSIINNGFSLLSIFTVQKISWLLNWMGKFMNIKEI